MAVHRLDDNAEALLRKISAEEGKKPAQWLSDLIREYAKGLTFNGQDKT